MCNRLITSTHIGTRAASGNIVCGLGRLLRNGRTSIFGTLIQRGTSLAEGLAGCDCCVSRHSRSVESWFEKLGLDVVRPFLGHHLFRYCERSVRQECALALADTIFLMDNRSLSLVRAFCGLDASSRVRRNGVGKSKAAKVAWLENVNGKA